MSPDELFVFSTPGHPTPGNSNLVLTVGQAKDPGIVHKPLSHIPMSHMLEKQPVVSTSKDIIRQTATFLHICNHPDSDQVISLVGGGSPSLVSMLPHLSPQSVFPVVSRRDLFKGKALQHLSIDSEQNSSRSPQGIWSCFLGDLPFPPSPCHVPCSSLTGLLGGFHNMPSIRL